MTGEVKHGVLEAGINLKNFIDKDDVICSTKDDGTKRPLVVLAFDEAHNIAEFPDDRGWSIYSAFRRCLCQLLDLPVFTLFLSTTGKFRLFSPDKQWGPSSRFVLGSKRVLPPITETGFDQFAKRAIENKTTLHKVVEDEWICSLGRPLCAFLVCSLCRRTDVVLRVGLPLAMQLLGKEVSLEPRCCALLLRSYWVVPRTSMRMLMTHRRLTGPLPAYLCGSLWSSIFRTQMRDP